MKGIEYIELKERLGSEFDEVQKRRRELLDSETADKSELDVTRGKAEGLVRAIELLTDHQMEVWSDEK